MIRIVGLSKVGNSIDQPTYVADICMDSVASLMWPYELISGSWCPPDLCERKDICLDQGDW
jgi:hypothetical protein